MERQVEELIYNYEEIFKSLCDMLGYTFSTNVNNYTSEECEVIIKVLKREYRNIWKEL